MDVDVKDLPQPTEEEWQWAERMAELDGDFPGESGIVAHRMRLLREAADRQRRFALARAALHRTARPRMNKAA